MGKPEEEASHAHYRELLERHVDGDLAHAEREELFEHLEMCEQCQQTLEAEERLLDRLSRIPKLVAPVDLRAGILREVERERIELSTALSQDERFADVFRAPGDEDLSSVHFAGTTATRRRRSLVTRYSPAVATGFLFAASLAAFFTADLSAFKPLNDLQGIARGGVGTVADAFRGTNRKVAAPVPTQVAEVPKPAPVVEPHPSTRHIEIAAGVPRPAEREKPSLAALVLRPTDDPASYGLDPDEFGAAIRQTAEADLKGKVESVDQFVYDGNRYRCYTLAVSDGWLDELAGSLEKYRTPAEPRILSAIQMQNSFSTLSTEVEFISAPSHILKSAVATNRRVAGSNAREVRIFLVE